MKYKLTEKEKEVIEKASDITITNYEIDNKGYIEIESLICAIEDLILDNKYLEERYNDLENDLETYYELKKEWRDDYE